MDFKSAFWQLEFHPESRYLTVFHANNKLYRYKRLTLGLKPAQGELNVALQPISAHIPEVHLIHDDLIVASENHQKHDQAIWLVMEAIDHSGLTLNPKKCQFGKPEMVINAEGVQPDPEKVEALKYQKPPSIKEDLVSFLCVMQFNTDFISNFAMRSAKLRELTKGKVRFNLQS